jgi:hypothetical protein
VLERSIESAVCPARVRIEKMDDVLAADS